ncbi:MAG: molybdenum cofactor biosynthesis protein MoaE [Phycisphaerales bacterium]|jgi:molybdopterin synthase catalytic subunit|nr:molybdenum cofactor biosynthesis protein MoaE [Phycisphaerales bacterium]
MATAPLIETTLHDGPVRGRGFDLHPSGGADVCFLGRTRAETHPRHGSLVCLDYEVHADMAEQQLADLAREAAGRWPLLAVRIQHASGRIAPGEASVAIEVLAGHRGEGFEACRWLIDTLKIRVPIWKREVWQDGTTWVDGTPVDTGS